MKLDGHRLASWNYGMALLLHKLRRRDWIHPKYHCYQNLETSPKSVDVQKQRDFLEKCFTATPDYTALCQWHLESTRLIEEKHRKKIDSKKAASTTSQQISLEMAKHRSAAIARFEAFEVKNELSFSSPSKQQLQRRNETEMVQNFFDKFWPNVFQEEVQKYDDS